MFKILLTGGAGFIGSHLSVLLLSKGYSILIYDNFSNSSLSVIEKINMISGKNVKYVKGDVRDQDLLIKIMREYGINAVIHLAGLKSVNESVLNPILYYDNNFVGSISLLHAMKASNIKTIVFSSSATVYGEPQYLPCDEGHPTIPLTPYGRSKLYIEQVLSDMCLSDKDFNVAVLRYFNPVGAHSSGLIGENPNGVPNNLMPYIAMVATGEISHLNIFGNDYDTVDGTGERDYIHVMDLAKGHINALEFISCRSGCHVFNLGTGKSTSVLKMITIFESVTGSSIPLRHMERRSGDLSVSYADVSKAKQMLNWEAGLDLEEMCRSSWLFKSKENKNLS